MIDQLCSEKHSRYFIGNRMPTGCRQVCNSAPIIQRWVCNVSLTCLHITASCGLLAIQGLNQYCLCLVLNSLYIIMATTAGFLFLLCRHSNCNSPAVNILTTCKEIIRFWKAIPFNFQKFSLGRQRAKQDFWPVFVRLSTQRNSLKILMGEIFFFNQKKTKYTAFCFKR